MSDPFAVPPKSLDIEGLSVMIAIPTHRDIHPRTVASLTQTQAALTERGVRFSIEIDHGGSVVHHGRTKMAHRFLKGDHNRLFWIDSDMDWEPKDFIRVLALSTVMDMVAGAYRAKQEPPLFMVNLDKGQTLEANEWGCLPFKGLGLGFCCIQRDVIEAVAEVSPRKRFHNVEGSVRHVFSYDEDYIDDDEPAQGEDMGFFAKAARLGYQLWVDPTLRLGHIGPHVFSGCLRDMLEQPAVSAAVSNAA